MHTYIYTHTFTHTIYKYIYREREIYLYMRRRVPAQRATGEYLDSETSQ